MNILHSQKHKIKNPITVEVPILSTSRGPSAYTTLGAGAAGLRIPAGFGAEADGRAGVVKPYGRGYAARGRGPPSPRGGAGARGCRLLERERGGAAALIGAPGQSGRSGWELSGAGRRVPPAARGAAGGGGGGGEGGGGGGGGERGGGGSGAEKMNRSFNKSQTLRYLECSAVEVKSKVSAASPSAVRPGALRAGRRGLRSRRCGRARGAPCPSPPLDLLFRRRRSLDGAARGAPPARYRSVLPRRRLAASRCPRPLTGAADVGASAGTPPRGETRVEAQESCPALVTCPAAGWLLPEGRSAASVLTATEVLRGYGCPSCSRSRAVCTAPQVGRGPCTYGELWSRSVSAEWCPKRVNSNLEHWP